MISAVAIFYMAGRLAADLFVDHFGFHLYPRLEPTMHRMIMSAIVCYIVLIAIPYMPGVEIALSLIAFFGPKICFLVYVSTVFALTLSYIGGRYIPPRCCARMFNFIGMVRAADLVDRIAPMSVEQRLAYLTENSPPGILSFLLRHRFIALAVAINLPGNSLIGGGGGIALFAGIAGIFPFPLFLLTIAIAVAPVPLVFFLTGL